MKTQEFEEYYQRWMDRITRLARRIARGDMDFADDLAQEALCKLAEFDLERVSRNAEGCIWRVVRDHMLNVYRREMRARVIVPPARARRASQRWGAGAARGSGKYRVRYQTTVPRHVGAVPVDDDELDALWDDL